MKNHILFLVSILFIFSGSFAQTGTYKADIKQTSIVWLAKKVTGQHTGTIALKSGELVFDKGKLTGGKFEIDMNSIVNTDLKDQEYNQKLIGHLKSDDFFSVAKFPLTQFVIQSASSTDGKNYAIKGELTIKGIKNPIEFQAVLTPDGKNMKATAQIKVNRAKFDIRYGSGSFFQGLGDNLIYDDFDLTVNLFVKK